MEYERNLNGLCHDNVMIVLMIDPPAPGDCLSSSKNAVEMTEQLSANLAVDGLSNTHSCTEPDEAFPWWAVDLGQAYLIESVTVTLPSVNHDNSKYHRYCIVSFITCNALD